MQIPSVGRIVIARMDPAKNNGADVAPAVISRVWGPHGDGGHTVNLKVLADAPDCPWLTSVRLVDDAEEAGDAAYIAWWPPRV